MIKTHHRKKITILFTLLIIAVLSGFLQLPVIPGVDLVFGSVITVVTIMLFGFRWGIISAILSSTYTMFLWNHPYALIIFLAEAIILGIVYTRTRRNIAIIDIGFWLLIGTPLVFFFYHGWIGLSLSAAKLIVLKQSLNGILNSLLGYIIVQAINSYTSINVEDNKIKYSNLIYNVLMLFILIPTLGFVIYHGQSQYNTFTEKADKEIRTVVTSVSRDMVFWSTYHMTPMNELAKELSNQTLESKEIQKKLDLLKRSLPDLGTIYVADQEGKTIAFAPLENEKGESTIGLDFSDRDYYRLVKETQEPLISDAFMGRGGVFEPIVTLVTPVIQDQQFQGFVCGSIKLTSITRVLEAISRENLNITLIDSKQQVIATTDPNLKPLIVHSLYSEYQKQPIGQKLYNISIESNPQSKLSSFEKSYYVYLDNQFGSHLHVKQTLLIEMPIGPTFKLLYDQLSNTLLLAIFFLIIAIIIGHFASKMMVVSLQNITQEAEDLPSKVLNENTFLPNRNWPKSNIYEVASLVKTFTIVEKRLLENFSKIKRNETRFKYLAHHDTLTRLPNKLNFIKKINKDLQSAQDMKAILFIDLDRFKVVNDTLGHSEGDKLLIQVSDRLRGLADKEDMLARQGGDEFLVYVNITNLEELTCKAEKYVEVLSKPYFLGDWSFDITASIGISIYPMHGKTVEDLIKNADIAMYEAKGAGKNNYYVFEERLLENVKSKIEMEKRLWQALKNQEFELFYQPLIDTRTQRIHGTEALLRWKNPESNSYVSPLDFISLAEETGIIIPLGEWVVKTATRQIKQWQVSTSLPLGLSVNISAKQFMSENFVETIAQALNESGIEPEYLTLEITESKVMENLDIAVRKMAQLKLLGVKLALDDFGTGYSSLNYLKVFSLDTVKVDRTFIADILKNNYNQSLVKAIIEVAHTINLHVVAEGVEREEQLSVLRELNCDYFQGYLFSKPLNIKQFEEKLWENGITGM